MIYLIAHIAYLRYSNQALRGAFSKAFGGHVAGVPKKYVTAKMNTLHSTKAGLPKISLKPGSNESKVFSLIY